MVPQPNKSLVEQLGINNAMNQSKSYSANSFRQRKTYFYVTHMHIYILHRYCCGTNHEVTSCPYVEGADPAFLDVCSMTSDVYRRSVVDVQCSGS